MKDHVYKILELVGSSEKSIEDAIQNAITRASRTIREMKWFEVMQTRGHIEKGSVRHYQVIVPIRIDTTIKPSKEPPRYKCSYQGAKTSARPSEVSRTSGSAGTFLNPTIRAVPSAPVASSLGGDEFAIIQEGGVTQHEGAIALALRIIHSITQPFVLDGHQANVGTSIGIALAPEHGADPEELLKKADLALYAVKVGGRNDVRVFQPEMLQAADFQQTAEGHLRDAIEREELEVYYQPVLNAKTRELCGVEALVRWRHPTKGLIGPDQFIPLAESTGLIVPLGDWVLQRACADAASWPAHIKVAVNISAVQFKKGNLFDVILCTLVETGLAPDRLELEITETVLLENQEAHLANIRQLKNLGISIAIDDFGTGYSSMNYLTVFPFDKIKIDKSFTQGALNRRDCKAVIASILALAQGLGTVTTAEGVETEEQLEYMREAGVDLVQGYLLGRPVPVSQLDILNAGTAREMVA